MPRIKQPKIHEEEEELMDQLSVNSEYEPRAGVTPESINKTRFATNRLQAINHILEEKKDKIDTAEDQQAFDDLEENHLLEVRKRALRVSRGGNAPFIKNVRDTDEDQDILTSKHFKLSPQSILPVTKVTSEMIEHEFETLGDNHWGSKARSLEELKQPFNEGLSYRYKPKFDLAPQLHNNREEIMRLVAKAPLRQLKSSNEQHKKQARKILLEDFKLKEELIDQIEEEDTPWQNEDLVNLVRTQLHKLDV